METVGALNHDQIVFPKLGIDISVSETAFTIFGLEIKWYGLLITVGLMLAMIYCFSQMKKYGIDPDRALDAVIGGVVGGLVGARAYYVIMSWDSYKDNFWSVFNIRNGGLAIYGGIIGSILVGGLIAKFRKVKLLPLLDLVAMGFLLGQGIGRWGNFANQEAFGCNTDSIFGMSGGQIQRWIVQNADTATVSAGNTLDASLPVHPCFLYESLWCLLGFVLLAIFAKKIRKFDGQILLMYIGWYGLERFFVEGLRTDSLMIGSLRVSQALAAVCVVASVILLIVFTLKVRRMGTEYELYVNTEESKRLIRESEEKKNRRESDTPVKEDEISETDETSETSEDTAEEIFGQTETEDKAEGTAAENTEAETSENDTEE